MRTLKGNKIFIWGLIGIAIIFTILSFIKYKTISNKGILVVAVIEEISRNKSGSSVHVKYFYKKQEFQTIFMPGYDFKLTIGRKFFIKILPNRPKQYDYYNIDVPECALDSNWRNGWKEIPNCDKE